MEDGVEIPPETLFDKILHWGLFVGAIFQMVAIAAVVFLPRKPEDQEPVEELQNGSKPGGGRHESASPQAASSGRKGKGKESKKRR
ncbi:PREDICTED: protein MANBAL-like [Branchiostoma belcheri]|uniref:Protein MANBAL-like n=1 Tax=Branchiostoma belcheri TaxID=7741 RepID=A0A6P4YP93_BRABE|nr:PREDICTED: protein MANBAL-like [Branchiostoma belcheri]